ncbi:M81 family metallopeptidase [Rhodopila sp.]|uniref:M81 family metallopeptidase n=1 Tax=Rhodopila sp. TaxID=2480087 RepID=UPI002B826038|nr:M81 family metallopeptidase [Rhodopila sp.]HVZ09186.1 M81 family metallopeptidase [Rhodopila sp.]
MNRPRVALLGFSIECNRFAPVATEADFRERTLIGGPDLVAEARAVAPRMLGELPGFIAAMDATGTWTPVPSMLAMAEPNGPVDQGFFDRLMQRWEADLSGAGLLDGVYLVLHGAGLTTADHDPEGTLLALVRRVVGPDVPVVATFDLHANVSDADVALLNGFIGYRTNPHLDMRERGAEAAMLLRRLIAGTKTCLSRIRLPIVPPTVTQLTGRDAPHRPYGELIDLGQQRMAEAPYQGKVLNVSVMGGFAYADTPFNGLTVVVTATEQRAADALAREIAIAGWQRRARFRPALTGLDTAVMLAKGTEDLGKPALAFADVADNPGGGGRGNTMTILQAFHAAGVREALVGIIHDPALAAEAHALGLGAELEARFNRDGGDAFSKPFAAPAVVAALLDHPVTGRRGIYANNTLDLGKAAALRLGGITVVVVSNRFQCADPMFFEAFGLDIGRARAVVVKSRGHFRGGFDEFFRHDQIVEVDAPGLTSPILSRFPWQYMPRPVLPIDDDAQWTPPA